MQRMQATCWARLWSGRRPAAILCYIICHEIFISVWNQMLLICMLPYLMYLVLQWYGSPLILHVTIPYRRPLVCLEDVTAGFYVCQCSACMASTPVLKRKRMQVGTCLQWLGHSIVNTLSITRIGILKLLFGILRNMQNKTARTVSRLLVFNLLQNRRVP